MSVQLASHLNGQPNMFSCTSFHLVSLIYSPNKTLERTKTFVFCRELSFHLKIYSCPRREIFWRQKKRKEKTHFKHFATNPDSNYMMIKIINIIFNTLIYIQYFFFNIINYFSFNNYQNCN